MMVGWPKRQAFLSIAASRQPQTSDARAGTAMREYARPALATERLSLTDTSESGRSNVDFLGHPMTGVGRSETFESEHI